MDADDEKREAQQPGPVAALAGFQRTYLRGLAHHLKPVVQVGQAGVTDAIVGAVQQALLAHELIKVRLQQPEDKKAMAAQLAARAGAELCGLVGHMAILYRPHPETPRIVLPARQGAAPGEDPEAA